jgi:hypothetical protein
MLIEEVNSVVDLLARYRAVGARLGVTLVVRSKIRASMPSTSAVPLETPSTQTRGKVLQFENDSNDAVLSRRIKLESIIAEAAQKIDDPAKLKKFNRSTYKLSLEDGEAALRQQFGMIIVRPAHLSGLARFCRVHGVTTVRPRS